MDSLAVRICPVAQLGIVYASWHIWEMLPLSAGLRCGAVGCFVAAFLLMFGGFLGIVERMPVSVATVDGITVIGDQ